MKAAKAPKVFKEMPYPPQKKKLWKRERNSITPANAIAPISQNQEKQMKMRSK